MEEKYNYSNENSHEYIIEHTLNRIATALEELAKVANCIDAEPVRHGHWISHGSYFTCSVCGEEQYGADTGRYYCQNCGAKMDEE